MFFFQSHGNLPQGRTADPAPVSPSGLLCTRVTNAWRGRHAVKLSTNGTERDMDDGWMDGRILMETNADGRSLLYFSHTLLGNLGVKEAGIGSRCMPCHAALLSH